MVTAFSTPANERSFSSLIDAVIKETGRTSSLRSLIGYANATIRECQALGLFSRDLREEEVVATDSPHVYVRPRNFRSVRAAKYMTSGKWPKYKMPGKLQAGQTVFFYAVDDSFVFKGVAVGETIALANYYWSTPLVYYGRLGTSTANYEGGPYAVRPAYYDLATLEWAYLNAAGDGYASTLGDETTEELRRLISSNWMIDEWWDLISEGTKAKIHKQYGDTRSQLSYSLYKQQQELLRRTSGVDAEIGAIADDE